MDTDKIENDFPEVEGEIKYDLVKIRRRIEEHLRKTDEPTQILEVARYLKVRLD
jgi:hypothetical protein